MEERRTLDSVVTSENLLEFQLHKLDIADTVKRPDETKEAEVKKEDNKTDAVVATGDNADPGKQSADEKPDDRKRQDSLDERFRELTNKTKAERAAREALERENAELKAKLNPPKEEPTELVKPDPKKYEDAFKYAEDLAAYSVRKAIQDKEAADRKVAQEAKEQERVDTWMGRLEVAKKAIPDLMEKLQASTVQVSEEVKNAVYDSDVGPQILLHLAENPEEAVKLAKLTVGKALIQIGRLEAKYSEPKKEVKEEVKTKEPEISKAPAPISPLKGASAPVDLPINSKGEWTGTHEQYKEARRAGKIK